MTLQRKQGLRRDTPKARAFADKRSPLKRTPMKRASVLKQRVPSRTLDDEAFRKAGYAVVRRRAGGRCEAGTRVCTGAHEQTHHRLPRSASSVRNKGRHHPSVLLAVCAACHGYIEENRAEGYEQGWLIRR